MKTLIIIFLICISTSVLAQNKNTEYAEIIVLQKVAKKESPIKEIYLNSISSNDLLNADVIKKIASTTLLLKHMNTNGWIFIERLGSQPSNTGPVWISFLFKKE